jgi:hypothetical protein
MRTIKFLTLLSVLFASTWICSYSQPSVKMESPDKKQEGMAKTLGSPADGMTRIIFTRQSSIVGAIVPHIVVDRGDSIVYDAVVVQDEKYADFDGNFDKARNVTQIYLMNDKMRFQLIQGVPLPGDIELTEKSEIIITPLKFTNVVTGSNEFDIKSAGYWESSQVLTPNVRLAGVVKSGGIVGWDRKPGKVRIEVIVPNGDQGFCPSFNAEAGRTYFIDYYYMKANFKIAEVQ